MNKNMEEHSSKKKQMLNKYIKGPGGNKNLENQGRNKKQTLNNHIKEHDRDKKQLHNKHLNENDRNKRQTLSLHLNKHDGSKIQELMTCELCGKTFEDRASIMKHIESHSKTPVCFCTLCNETFVEFDDLDAHVNVCRMLNRERLREILKQLAEELDIRFETDGSFDIEDSCSDFEACSKTTLTCGHARGDSTCVQAKVVTLDLLEKSYTDSNSETGQKQDSIEDMIEIKRSGDRDIVCEMCGIKCHGILNLSDHHKVHEATEREFEEETVEVCKSSSGEFESVEQNWNQHIWDTERSLVYAKGDCESSKSEDTIVQFQTDQSAVCNISHDVDMVPVMTQLENLSSSTAYYNSSPIMDIPAEYFDWASSSMTSLDDSGTTKDCVLSDIIANRSSEAVSFENIGDQTYLVSCLRDSCCRSYTHNVCGIGCSDQIQSQGEFSAQNELPIERGNHVINIMAATSEIKQIYGDRTVTVEPLKIPGDCIYEITNSQSVSNIMPDSSVSSTMGYIQLFQCSYCQGMFESKADLGKHIQIEHVTSGQNKTTTKQLTSTNKLPCQQCGRTYSPESHMKVHRDIKPFKCDKCSKSYWTNVSLDILNEIHTKEKQECHICGKMLNPAFLISHVRSHDDNTSNKITSNECDICGKSFEYMQTLASHQYSKHALNEKVSQSLISAYKCPHCKKEMKCKSTFIAHMATHTGVYPFECSICKKGFLFQGVLKIHRSRFHSDTPKKMKCKECGKEFYTASNHQPQQGHSVTWSFECSECGKGFRWRDIYETHMKMHKGQAPLWCDLCEKTFTVKRKWVAHQHHHDKPYRCEQCNENIRLKNSSTIHNPIVEDFML